MITDKLKKITFLSLILIYAHGIEEIMTGFLEVDSVVTTWNERLASIPEAVYWASHIPFWLLLIPLFLLVLGGKWTLRIMVLFGFIFLFEIHHLLGALTITYGYYPGMITASFYPIIGFFYWKELIYNFRK